jgi:hypothetical protein
LKLTFCVACGRDHDLNHHHLVPRAAGGSDDESNLITLCRECHGKVHDVAYGLDHAELIRSGMAKARANGTKSGQPIGRPRIPEKVRQDIRDAYAQGGVGMRTLAKRFGVSLGTVLGSLS